MHKFLRLNSWASAVCSFGKINECLFIPNCKRKIIWLLVDNIQASVALQYFMWQMKCQATSTLLDENLTCEFKHKNSFTFSKSCMKTEQFLLLVKSSLYSQLTWRTQPQSKWKPMSLRLWCGFLCNCFLSGWKFLCCMQGVLLHVLLRTTDEILKFTFSTVILSCRGDWLWHTDFNSVKLKCMYFSLAAFVFFFSSYTLCNNYFFVNFAELSI